MEHIISKFISTAEIGEMKPFGNGHINDTYVVSDREGTPRWILQRVNHLVFPRIEVLQRNVAIVSDTMRERLEAEGDPEAERKYLYFYPNLEEPEKNYYHDGENYWRVCRFIPESMSMSELTPKAARYAGAAFGQFEEILSVIPEGRRLHCSLLQKLVHEYWLSVVTVTHYHRVRVIGHYVLLEG